MPLNRNETLQEGSGHSLPASTQWDIVADQAERAEPVFEELVRQAAQGDVLCNDDTTVKILAMMDRQALTEDLVDEPVEDSTEDGSVEDSAEMAGDAAGSGTSPCRIPACGSQSATEKPEAQAQRHVHHGHRRGDRRRREDRLVPQRTPARGREPQGRVDPACDGPSSADPDVRCLVAELAARAENDPWQLLSARATEIRRRGGTVSEGVPPRVGVARSGLSQRRARQGTESLACGAVALCIRLDSGPVMEELHAWLGRQFDEHRVEPNSTLGASIAYMRRHWEKLTLFLRVAGAPLDNNICERALKMAIRHRKNSLFYKTPRGARVGDIFMSLIHTCRLCAANPFDYLTELERHADQTAWNPANWMPWNYRQTLANALMTPTAS